MQEIDVGDKHYRTGKLTAFDQLHVLRKLAPLFSGMGESYAQMPNIQVDGGTVPPRFWQSLEPIAHAVSEMSTADSEFVLKTCLKACQRLNENGTWARLTAANGELMFDDIDVMTMLQLAFAVIQDNLGNFLSAPSPNGSGGAAALSPSLGSA